MKIENSYKKIKILLISYDPAGGSILSIINEKLKKKYYVKNLFFGPSKIYLNSYEQNENIIRSNVSLKNLKKNFLSFNPNLIITASGVYNNVEHYSRIIAKENKIKCISVLDYWSEYNSRFSRKFKNKIEYSIPDWIFVMDSRSKKDLAQELNINSRKIFISGCINLENIKKKNKAIKKKEEFLKTNKIVITFFSDAFYPKKNKKKYFGKFLDKRGNSVFGYTPDHILKILLESIYEINRKLKKEILFIYKPHPREDYLINKKIIKKFQNIDKNIKLKTETSKKTFQLSIESHLIFGMSSIALFEASITNKPTFSVQIGLDKKNIFDPCLSNRFNYSISVNNRYKLIAILKSYLQNTNSKKFKLLKKYVNIDGALSKTLNKIDKIILDL